MRKPGPPKGYQPGNRRIVIKPKLKAEPDLDKVALAIVSDVLENLEPDKQP
jgi:hypothetical protein